jgi:hypothetical protein
VHSFRFRSADPVPSAGMIGALRRVTTLGIAEIRRRAAEGQPLIEIEVFDNAWQESRDLLNRLLAEIETGVLRLTIHEFTEFTDDEPEEELLPLGRLRERLGALREIEVEQDCAMQLRLGVIRSPEEYEGLAKEDA